MKGFSTYAEYRDSLVNRGRMKYKKSKSPIHRLGDSFYMVNGRKVKKAYFDSRQQNA